MLKKSTLLFFVVVIFSFIFIPKTICITTNIESAFVVTSNEIVKNYENILKAEKEKQEAELKKQAEEKIKNSTTIATRSTTQTTTSRIVSNNTNKDTTNSAAVQTEQKFSIPSTYKGYGVLGRIDIAKIGLSLNILSVTNEASLNVSVTRFYGPASVNQIGNLVITGHNSGDSTLFGRLGRLGIGDTVNITGMDNITVTYKIYNIFEVYPEEGVKAVKHDMAGTKEITLINCTDDGVKRKVYKAREI